MKLQIAQLRDGENPFDFTSEKDAWVSEVMRRVEAQGYAFHSPMSVGMRLTKLEPDYYLRGKMSFHVGQTCARCAEEFKLAIEHGFDVALAHIGPGKHRTAELTEESEELDINFFEGNEIDLAPILEEQFFLSLPYQAVCQAECKGICQKCGKNLNTGSCSCDRRSPLNPFSALERFRI